MGTVVKFYPEFRPDKLGRLKQLSLIAFNRLYIPDPVRLVNPPRGEMPFTYYHNIKSGNKVMVTYIVSDSVSAR